MRIDAHQHFWIYSPNDYAWITDTLAPLKGDRLPADLKPLLHANGFDASIAVQARQSLEETRWLLELSDQNPFIRGVVGWVDLRSPDLPSQLERFAAHPRLVGVRHVVQDEPDDRFLLREDFQAGIAQLARYHLAYDLLVFPRQLPAAIELVRKFPEQRFVLDHIAKPPIASGEIDAWAKDIGALAQCSNCSCKLSGVVTEARWNHWKPEDFVPYLDVIVEAFGTARLLIGSDWPVCTLSADYGSTMTLVRDYIRQFSSDEQDNILGFNCQAFYGIG